MRKWLLILGLFIAVPAHAACGGSHPNWTAASINDVASCLADGTFANGDTITLDSGTSSVTSQQTWNKAFTLQGPDCTLGTVSGKSGIPTSCGAIVQDGMTSGFSIIWTCQPGYGHILHDVEFDGSATRSGNDGAAFFTFDCTNREQSMGSPTYVHVYRTLWDWEAGTGLSRIFWCDACIGVMDHSYLKNADNQLLYSASANWYGDSDEAPHWIYRNGDESRYYPIHYANATYPQTFFYEDNVLSGAGKGCLDGDKGGRFVARFNAISKCSFASHGTEGRARSMTNGQIYENDFDMTGASSLNHMAEMRDGNYTPIWGNTATGWTASGQSVSLLNNYRGIIFFLQWGPEDGTAVVDVNHAGNPQASFTVSGCSGACTALTATVSGAGWSTSNGGQWAGYTIRKTGVSCTNDANQNCFSAVQSNTSDTITFEDDSTSQTGVSFSDNDTFDLNLIDHAFDMPGRRDTSLLIPHRSAVNGVTTSGTTATFELESGDTWSELVNGDYVAITGGAFFPDNEGVYQITSKLTSPDRVTFEYAGGLATTTAELTKVPPTQATIRLYQWNNTNLDDSSNIKFIQGNASTLVIRENEHYIDYDPSLGAFDGTVGGGNNPVYVGNKAGLNAATSNMTTCDLGAMAWVTDEGEWDSTNGATADGKKYECTATNTWTALYVESGDGGLPDAYPHPLVTGADVTDPTPGNSGMLAASSVTSSGFTVSWTKGTDDTSAQSALQYNLCRSTTNNVDTAANAIANGTCNGYSTDIASDSFSGLTASATYYFNVVIKDEAGNTAAYTMNSQATNAAAGNGGGSRTRLRIQ